MKNLIVFARKRGGKSMAEKLAAEIMDAYNEQGGAFNVKRICIGWLKQTVHLLTSVFNDVLMINRC